MLGRQGAEGKDGRALGWEAGPDKTESRMPSESDTELRRPYLQAGGWSTRPVTRPSSGGARGTHGV